MGEQRSRFDIWHHHPVLASVVSGVVGALATGLVTWKLAQNSKPDAPCAACTPCIAIEAQCSASVGKLTEQVEEQRKELSRLRSILADKSIQVERAETALRERYEAMESRVLRQASFGVMCIVQNHIGNDWIDPERGWTDTKLCEAAGDATSKFSEQELEFVRAVCGW